MEFSFEISPDDNARIVAALKYGSRLFRNKEKRGCIYAAEYYSIVSAVLKKFNTCLTVNVDLDNFETNVIIYCISNYKRQLSREDKRLLNKLRAFRAISEPETYIYDLYV